MYLSIFCTLYTVFFLSVMEAVKIYGKMLTGRTTEDIFGNFAAVWTELAHEDQFRWVRSFTVLKVLLTMRITVTVLVRAFL